MCPARALVLLGGLAACSTACATARSGAVPVAAPTPVAPVAAAAASVPAPPPPPAPAPTWVRSFEGIDEYALANGLRLLLFPDPTTSTVTVNVTYLVGSRHEGAGETGMAHLLEHMMFKGTPRHPSVLDLLDQRGASANGTTWQDRTNYYETLPATGDNLRWALDLEADRMVNAAIADAALATEWTVVRNELEEGENDPRQVLEQRVTAAAFQWHGYGRDTIGARSDLEHVPADRLRAFYQRYYQPDNAIVVIAGAFDPAAAVAEVSATFGLLPRPTRTLPATYTVEPVQDGERAVVVRRGGDTHLLLAQYHTVAGADPDHVAFDAIGDVLTREPTGRLYRALVVPGLATEVWAEHYLFRDPSYLQVGVQVRDARAVARARAALVATVEGFAAHPVTAAEVERFRAAATKDLTLGFADSAQVAIELSEWAAAGDWRLLFAYRDRLAALTAADVQRAAVAYLTAANRTLGEFVPTATPARAPAPPVPDVAAAVAALRPQPGATGEPFVATLDNLAARLRLVDLPGGLRAALVPRRTRGGRVHIELVLRHGDATSLAGQAAVARLLGRVAERGTRTRTFAQLTLAFDRLTADVELHASAGEVAVSIDTVRGSVPAVIALVGDMLRHPALDRRELAVVQQEALAALDDERQDPERLAARRLAALLAPWPADDPRASLDVDAEAAAVARVTAAQLAAYHRRFWGTGHGELVAVGDVDPDELGRAVTAALAGWPSRAPYARLADKLWAAAPAAQRIDTRDKAMAIVVAGHQLALDDASPDAAAVEVASAILGGSTGSRLWMRLREHDGYSYGVWGELIAGDEDPVGEVALGASLAPANLARGRAAIAEEVARLRDAGPTDDEVAKAKVALRELDDGALADDDALAGRLLRDRYLGRDLRWHQARRAAIAAVTTADVARVLRQYLDPAKLTWVEAGDLSQAP